MCDLIGITTAQPPGKSFPHKKKTKTTNKQTKRKDLEHVGTLASTQANMTTPRNTYKANTTKVFLSSSKL